MSARRGDHGFGLIEFLVVTVVVAVAVGVALACYAEHAQAAETAGLASLSPDAAAASLPLVTTPDVRPERPAMALAI